LTLDHVEALPQNLAHGSVAGEWPLPSTGSDHFKIARRERNESGTKSTISSDDAQLARWSELQGVGCRYGVYRESLSHQSLSTSQNPTWTKPLPRRTLRV